MRLFLEIRQLKNHSSNKEPDLGIYSFVSGFFKTDYLTTIHGNGYNDPDGEDKFFHTNFKLELHS